MRLALVPRPTSREHMRLHKVCSRTQTYLSYITSLTYIREVREHIKCFIYNILLGYVSRQGYATHSSNSAKPFIRKAQNQPTTNEVPGICSLYAPRMYIYICRYTLPMNSVTQSLFSCPDLPHYFQQSHRLTYGYSVYAIYSAKFRI